MAAELVVAAVQKRVQAGPGTAASPVPCRAGKTRVKNFSRFAHIEKPRAIMDLATTYGKNPRCGREPAGKPENRRIPFAITVRC